MRIYIHIVYNCLSGASTWVYPTHFSSLYICARARERLRIGRNGTVRRERASLSLSARSHARSCEPASGLYGLNVCVTRWHYIVRAFPCAIYTCDMYTYIHISTDTRRHELFFSYTFRCATISSNICFGLLSAFVVAFVCVCVCVCASCIVFAFGFAEFSYIGMGGSR